MKFHYHIFSEPDFVSSLEDENHVYFFFRESAVEYMNCGKVNISFVDVFVVVVVAADVVVVVVVNAL